MIPVQGFDGATVAVLGCDASVAAALNAGGATVVDAAAHDLCKPNGFDGIARLVVGAGIAHLYPSPDPVVAGAWAAGVPVDNPLGLFFQSFATRDWGDFYNLPKVIAVTGPQGSAATSRLIHHIAVTAGRASQMGQHAPLALEPAHDDEVTVLDLPPAQIELARALTPDVAVLADVVEGEFAAMRRLFAEGGPDRCVINVDTAEGQFLANQMAEGPKDDRVIQMSSERKLETAAWSVFMRKGFLSEYRKGRQVAAFDLQLMVGLVPNVATAAYAAGRCLGLSPKVIEAAMRSFNSDPIMMG